MNKQCGYRKRVYGEDSKYHDSDSGELAVQINGNPWDGRTILIVDDMADSQEFLRSLMESAGRLESAYNGLEAIEAAHRENPDLILMDIRMPVMNGVEATIRLKSDPATKDTPILVVTAQSVDEDGVRSLDEYADGFITKPVDIGTFRKEIGRVLGVST